MSWLTAVERLNRSAASELADARRQRHQLLVGARALAPYALPPSAAAVRAATDGAGCAATRCAFHACNDGAALCELVRTLDGVDPSLTVAVTPLVDVDGLVSRFLAALEAAIDAVRYCRLMEHPSGRCWFVVDGVQPACGEVLRLAHQVAS